MPRDIFQQIENAASQEKLDTITTQCLADLVRFVETSLRFSEPATEVEGIALAALAKATGSADSVVLLSRRGHRGDVEILVRAIMEVACRTLWVLADEAEQEKRMLVLRYNDAYNSLGQVQKILADTHENLLANRLDDMQANIARIRSHITDQFPDVEFGKSGKLRMGTSFQDILTALGGSLTYNVLYPILSSPAHSDVKALAKHVMLNDDGRRFSIHALCPGATVSLMTSHFFLVLLARKVNENLSQKLRPDFNRRIVQEAKVNNAIADRSSSLGWGQGSPPRGSDHSLM